MPVIISTLRDVSPDAFFTLGFDEAAGDASSGSDDFTQQVLRVVESGHVWSGEGQPSASVVLQANASALRVSEIQMRAAHLAMSGLGQAMLNAKSQLADVEQHLASLTSEFGADYATDDEGTVSVNGEAVTGDDGPVDLFGDVQVRIQRILHYAQTADLTAKSLLDQIVNSRPVFTASFSFTAQRYNNALIQVAKANIAHALVVQQIWLRVPPEHWLDPEYDLGQELKEIGIQLQSAAASFPDVAAFFTAGAPLVQYGLLGGGAGAVVAGAVLLIGSVGYLVYSAITGDDRDEEGKKLPDPVNLLGQPPEEPKLADVDGLDDTVGEFYLDPDSTAARAGYGTVADAARLQLANPSADLGDDYVERARDLRDGLDQWIEDNETPEEFRGVRGYPSEVSGAEFEYAEAHREELDEVLQAAEN